MKGIFLSAFSETDKPNCLMRVAMFVGSFPLISETFILRQITGLIELGHEVDIFAENRPPEDAPIHPEVFKYDLLARTKYVDAPMESTYWEMPVYPLSGETWVPDSEKPIPNMLRVIKAGPAFMQCFDAAPELTRATLSQAEFGFQAESLSALYRLSALCAKPNVYDVAHAHFGPVGNAFRFVKALWNVPFAVTFHGYDLCTVPRKEGTDIYRRLFDTADVITAHSKYARHRLEQLHCPEQKIRNLRVGVNLRDFPFRARKFNPNETVRILSVARLTEIKGLEYSIKAVAGAIKNFSNIQYDIVGDGPLREKLEKLIQELGLKKFIKLHGAKDGNFVKQMMALAHIFILPSINLHGDQEGTPVSLMEAQASGIPVIATNTGGIPEVVLDGKSGFLVPDRNVEALSESLIKLVKNPRIWEELGKSGRKHIEDNYDVNKLNSDLENLYKEMTSEYGEDKSESSKSAS